MIVELTATVSFQDKNIQRLTYQSTLFPAPATKGETLSVSVKAEALEATHVSHAAIKLNSIRMSSIQRTCRLEEATLQSPRGAIHRQYGGFSMDQAERANFEYFPATCRLSTDLSASCQQG